MKFGEKVRAARMAAGMTQLELAERSGISLRTIQNYESGERLPKQREYYSFLAGALDMTEEDLRDEGRDAPLPVRGSRPAREVTRLLREIRALYAGGELAEEDMDAMMRAVQDAYWIAKESRRRSARHGEEHA